MATASLYRAGGGSPMLLIHGFSGTPATWTPLLPALARHHDVLAATLLGHRGGPGYLPRSPATPAAMADVLEREMDAAGFERAHLVGHSLGGWLALELAVRGRALSTTALAPAGGWSRRGSHARRLGRMFRRNDLLTTLMGARAAQLMRRRRFRALALRAVVARPADVPASLAVEMAEAAADCAISVPLLEHLGTAGFGELGEIDSPVQIVWGTKDRILRWPGYAQRFRQLVPGAQWIQLAGLGHCLMFDDASLTAQTILEFTQRADAGRVNPRPVLITPPSR
ncbi:MAG: alpha/beta fold hydrolase [Solirubrobacteraceae bacterium]